MLAKDEIKIGRRYGLQDWLSGYNNKILTRFEAKDKQRLDMIIYRRLNPRRKS